MPDLLGGRVAVVTGAGRGLGKAYAMSMAKQGARVVVNDLGSSIDGMGFSRGPADEIVEEIRKRGGIAIANYDTVATPDGAHSIIESALDSFGRLDILVNNAGIFRQSMIFDITDEEWDLVIKVHLYGTFYCTRAASRFMKERKYGRIINTSSIAGLGYMEEAHYSAAKEGIVGFTRTVARDLGKFGITVNAIRPRAGTRMTLESDIYQGQLRSVGKERADKWRRETELRAPEDVSPLIVYLASEQASAVNGCVFHVAHNYIALYDDPPRLWRIITKKEGRWLPEELTELLPASLAGGLNAQPAIPLLRFTSDAEAWEWANGLLREVSPMVEQS